MTTISSGLLWFGAAVSLAEIMTGAALAPLGFGKGLLATVLGHAIGCALFFFAGLIGGRTGKGAMDTVKLSFGEKGAALFSTLNVLQLVGWTAVMIASGASAAVTAAPALGAPGWSLVIGALIILWAAAGLKNLGKINIAAMSVLFALTVVLSYVVFRADWGAGSGLTPSPGVPADAASESLSFGLALELSIAMPLSWLPLVSDYTRSAKKPFASTLVSSVVYFAVSCWMYIIGLGAALFTGESDVTAIMTKAGLGIAALLTVIFSATTTTFLDVYSAAASSASIFGKIKERPAALVVGAVGVLLAIFAPVTRFEEFLYLIGSVFAPMVSILIADFFIIKRRASAAFDWPNLALWLVGFVVYRLFMLFDSPLGSTVPVMAITFALCLAFHRIRGGFGKTAALR